MISLAEKKAFVKDRALAARTLSSTGAETFIPEVSSPGVTPLPFNATIGSFFFDRFLGVNLSGPEAPPSAGSYDFGLQRLTDDSIRAGQLTKLRSISILQDIKNPFLPLAPKYPHETLYSHDHYSLGNNLNGQAANNSVTAFGLGSLIKSSDDYAVIRQNFQKRFENFFPKKNSTLSEPTKIYDSALVELFQKDPTINAIGGLKAGNPVDEAYYASSKSYAEKVSFVGIGKFNNFVIDKFNVPSVTVGGLTYDAIKATDNDLNSEDRDIFYAMGYTQDGLCQINNIRFEDIGTKTFYVAEVSFFWWDGFTFDQDFTGGSQNAVSKTIGYSSDLQQAGWARPFTDSIRVDDTISGFVEKSQLGSLISNIAQVGDGTGNDVVSGTIGNDVLLGRRGNDTLIGRSGDDVMSGGKGSDRFILNGPGQGFDQILDFTSQNNVVDASYLEDKLVISKAAFGFGNDFILGTLDPSRLYSSNGTRNATQLSHRFIYDTRLGTLWFDADGSGTQSSPIPLASLSGAPILSNSDFLIVA